MTKRADLPKGNWGTIRNTGMGGFLDPPGYPTHKYSVVSLYGDSFSMSLPAVPTPRTLSEFGGMK